MIPISVGGNSPSYSPEIVLEIVDNVVAQHFAHPNIEEAMEARVARTAERLFELMVKRYPRKFWRFFNMSIWKNLSAIEDFEIAPLQLPVFEIRVNNAEKTKKRRRRRLRKNNDNTSSIKKQQNEKKEGANKKKRGRPRLQTKNDHLSSGAEPQKEKEKDGDKKKRGRPRLQTSSDNLSSSEEPQKEKKEDLINKKRGRPRLQTSSDNLSSSEEPQKEKMADVKKKKRGRPRLQTSSDHLSSNEVSQKKKKEDVKREKQSTSTSKSRSPSPKRPLRACRLVKLKTDISQDSCATRGHTLQAKPQAGNESTPARETRSGRPLLQQLPANARFSADLSAVEFEDDTSDLAPLRPRKRVVPLSDIIQPSSVILRRSAFIDSLLPVRKRKHLICWHCFPRRVFFHAYDYDQHMKGKHTKEPYNFLAYDKAFATKRTGASQMRLSQSPLPKRRKTETSPMFVQPKKNSLGLTITAVYSLQNQDSLGIQQVAGEEHQSKQVGDDFDVTIVYEATEKPMVDQNSDIAQHAKKEKKEDSAEQMKDSIEHTIKEPVTADDDPEKTDAPKFRIRVRDFEGEGNMQQQFENMENRFHYQARMNDRGPLASTSGGVSPFQAWHRPESLDESTASIDLPAPNQESSLIGTAADLNLDLSDYGF